MLNAFAAVPYYKDTNKDKLVVSIDAITNAYVLEL